MPTVQRRQGSPFGGVKRMSDDKLRTQAMMMNSKMSGNELTNGHARKVWEHPEAHAQGQRRGPAPCICFDAHQASQQSAAAVFWQAPQHQKEVQFSAADPQKDFPVEKAPQSSEQARAAQQTAVNSADWLVLPAKLALENVEMRLRREAEDTRRIAQRITPAARGPQIDETFRKVAVDKDGTRTKVLGSQIINQTTKARPTQPRRVVFQDYLESEAGGAPINVENYLRTPSSGTPSGPPSPPKNPMVMKLCLRRLQVETNTPNNLQHQPQLAMPLVFILSLSQVEPSKCINIRRHQSESQSSLNFLQKTVLSSRSHSWVMLLRA